MKPIAVETTVARPAAEVFEFLAVLANHEAFLDHFLVNWSFSGQASGVGAKGRARTDAPGSQDWTEFEIIAAEAPREIVEQGIGAEGKRRTRGIYRLTERAAGETEISFELEWLAASRAEKLCPPLTRAFLRRPNRKAMRRLARLLSRSGPETA